MGYLIDMDHPYITLDNDYIETRLVDPEKIFRCGNDLRGTQDPRLTVRDAEQDWPPMKWRRDIERSRSTTITCEIQEKGTDE